ncbi:hypothetical protein KKC94_05140 [Patescibacteria group bacterium]|nr:hypothetical protein [Patescibacteria group bacterium]
MPNLKNPYSGRERAVRLEPVKEKGKLGEGIEGIVDVVRVSIGDSDNELSRIFARKSFKDKELGREGLDLFVNNWQELKKRGLPVVPTLRIEEGSEAPYVIMTDLTNDGKNEVVALNDFEPSPEEQKLMEASGEQRMYKYPRDYILELTNIKGIEQQLSDLLKTSVEKGVLLEHDVPFLVVDKETKEGNLVLGDLRTVFFMDVKEKDEENEVITKPVSEVHPEEIEDEGDTYIEMVNLEALSRWARFLNESLDPDNRIDLKLLDETYGSLSSDLWDRRKKIGINDPDDDGWDF